MYEKQYIRTNGIMMHVVMAGPSDGEPVVLLHGFPEFWYGWHHQMDFLAAQGYRVIVPDQRGYNLTDKPTGVESYRLDELARDITGLLDALGIEKVYLAAHDWGAVVAWHLATRYADRLKKMVILNVPYPTILTDQIGKGNWKQLAKSWYVVFFQIPFLSEGLMSIGNYEPMMRAMRASSKAETFTDEELELYRTAWSQPGAIKAIVSWYRAIVRFGMGRGPIASPENLIQIPVLMLWGEQDVALSKDLAQPSIDLCANGRLIFYPEASHWLQHDEIDAVNAELMAFFTQNEAPHIAAPSDASMTKTPATEAPAADAPATEAQAAEKPGADAPAKKAPAKRSTKAKAAATEPATDDNAAPKKTPAKRNTKAKAAAAESATEDKPAKEKAPRKPRTKKTDADEDAS